MNRRMFTRSAIVLALALTTAAATLFSTPAVTRADGSPSFTTTLYNPGTCTNTQFSIKAADTWDFTGVPLPATQSYEYFIGGNFAGSESNLSIDNSGSIKYFLQTSYPDIAQPYTIKIVYTFRDANGTPVVIETFSGTCSSNVLTMSVSISYPSPDSSDGFKGPYYPSDFVLREITCNTPLLSSADGEPAGSASLLAGQHWYVNPVPVVVNGKSYTEVSVVNRRVFIPTSCVG